MRSHGVVLRDRQFPKDLACTARVLDDTRKILRRFTPAQDDDIMDN